MTAPTADELERRQKISEGARASSKRQAYYNRIRGCKRGPDSIETRARKSASHLAPPGTAAWELYYMLSLTKLALEAEVAVLLERCSE
jgi:hypothetical protein